MIYLLAPERRLVAAQRRRCIYRAAEEPVEVGNCHPRRHPLRPVIPLFLLSFSTKKGREREKSNSYSQPNERDVCWLPREETINCPGAKEQKSGTRGALRGGR